MTKLTKRLMSEAVRCKLVAVMARQEGDHDKADWNRFLALFFYAVAENPGAVEHLEADVPLRRAA